MRTHALAFPILAAGAPHGLIHYGEKPPAGSVRSRYYHLTSANPFLTVVTIRRGRVANLERNRKTD